MAAGHNSPLPATPGKRTSSRSCQDADDSRSRRWAGPATAMAVAMAAAAIAVLVLTGMQSSAIYSKPVDQLLAQKAKFLGRPVRADGLLVHGSLVKRDQPCEYRFTIEKNGAELPVRFAQCVVPDTFRDVAGIDVGVTVEGELQSNDTFEATSVLAKCPSKYEMQQRKQHGEEMPHGPLAVGQPLPSMNVQALP
ncbi:MAG TPA: cytochrome c maturation protein CcmE [Polyangiaceae bacterium]|nr:cytochrome c maturation protein CcmE [Polyangiaceae bacterium]